MEWALHDTTLLFLTILFSHLHSVITTTNPTDIKKAAKNVKNHISVYVRRQLGDEPSFCFVLPVVMVLKKYLSSERMGRAAN